MKCGDEMGILLSRYVDGELSEEQKGTVDAHCEACGECREQLSIFQHNDQMLANALSDEAFGVRALDGVLDRLEGRKPAGKRMWRIPWNGWMQATAAAVILILLVLSLAVPTQKALLDLETQYAKSERHFDRYMDDQEKRAEDLRATIRKREREIERLSAMYVVNHSEDAVLFVWQGMERTIKIATKFEFRDQFVSYSALRRSEGESAWETLEEGMFDSAIEDKTAVPARNYWYKFVAHRKDGTTLDSVPQRIMLPAPDRVDPRKGVTINCVDIGLTDGVARFRLTRYVDENPRHWDGVVHAGEAIGSVAELPGMGKFDFGSRWTLENVSEGDQTLVMDLMIPKIDPETGIHIEDVRGNPQFEHERKVIAIRPNLKAVLRRPGQEPITLWKGQSAVVSLP